MMMKHHARSLRCFTLRMTDVKTLYTQRINFSYIKA